MLQNIFQKKNFSTIIIVILLAFFLVFAIMRYRKVNEGMEETSEKKPSEKKNIVNVLN